MFSKKSLFLNAYGLKPQTVIFCGTLTSQDPPDPHNNPNTEGSQRACLQKKPF